MKKIGRILRLVVERLVVALSFIILYLPIILGILAPMLVVMGFDFYISWLLIGYNFTSWTWYYYLIPAGLLPLYIFLEMVIFCFGLVLFLSGFLTLVCEKIHGVNLVRSGIYKYIRHPQNLGVIMMLFPFTLYISGFSDIGIRMGEIASWMFFTIILCVYSYYEEWRLLVRWNSLYSDYYSATGFMVPHLFRSREKSLTSRRILRNVGISLVAFVFLFVLFYCLVILFEPHLIRYK